MKQCSIIGILVGLAIFVLGIYTINGFHEDFYGSRSSSGLEFGADFYTDEYQATAEAANNIDDLGDYLEEQVKYEFLIKGLFISGIGLVVIAAFGCVLCFTSKRSGTEISSEGKAVLTAKPQQNNYDEELPEL